MKSFNSELKLNPGLKSNLKPHQINWMLDMGKQWSFKLTRNLTISTAEQKRAWYWHKAPETSHRLMICIIHSGIFFLKNKQTRNYLDGLSKEAIKSWCMKATMLALKGQAIIWHLWERLHTKLSESMNVLMDNDEGYFVQLFIAIYQDTASDRYIDFNGYFWIQYDITLFHQWKKWRSHLSPPWRVAAIFQLKVK